MNRPCVDSLFVSDNPSVTKLGNAFLPFLVAFKFAVALLTPFFLGLSTFITGKATFLGLTSILLSKLIALKVLYQAIVNGMEKDDDEDAALKPPMNFDDQIQMYNGTEESMSKYMGDKEKQLFYWKKLKGGWVIDFDRRTVLSASLGYLFQLKFYKL
ncbi:hypothetical protein RUM43_013221 [Polyplax serrata]|uniref:Uncharacterized protein n=1 Tax=Polyplax serrata TaxID=468196 RepID=A0AAN8S035_POLSC